MALFTLKLSFVEEYSQFVLSGPQFVVHIVFSPSSWEVLFSFLLVQCRLVGEDEVVHYSNNLCKFRRLLFLVRSCGAHLHSRYTIILPGPLGCSNGVQRIICGFNVSE